MHMVGNHRMVLTLMLVMGCSKEYGFSSIIAEEPGVDPAEFMPCDFSPTSVAGMSIYDCNPVFENTDEMWFDAATSTARSVVGSVGFYTNLVMGFPLYQIWYVGRLDASGESTETDFLADWGLGTAISENGVDWDVHVDNPLVSEVLGRWDQDGMNSIQIARDDARDRYIMAYQGYVMGGLSSSVGLGAAESTDGVTWTFPEGPPPLDQMGPTLDGIYISWPCALYVSDVGAITAYIGGAKEVAGEQPDEVDLFAASVSENLRDWDLYDDPVLEAGPEGYDAAAISSASVVKYDGTYYMFYVGAEDWVDIGGSARSPEHQTLNLATSSTGISWTKHPDNPLAIHLTDEKEVDAVAAQVVGDSIHLWITDNYAEPGDPARDAVGYYIYRP